ncbi:MAG: hypothetical protein ABI624_10485 [Casimicrobiaceae bacterium]
MRLPPALHVVPGRSHQALAWIVGVAFVTCSVPIGPPLALLLALLVLAWAGDRVHVIALRRGPRAVHAFWVSADRTLVVRLGTGRLAAGSITSASYVGARLTTIVWRPDGFRRARSIWVLPDMLAPDDFRALRVLLRYGRSDAEQGEPASQA